MKLCQICGTANGDEAINCKGCGIRFSPRPVQKSECRSSGLQQADCDSGLRYVARFLPIALVLVGFLIASAWFSDLPESHLDRLWSGTTAPVEWNPVQQASVTNGVAWTARSEDVEEQEFGIKDDLPVWHRHPPYDLGVEFAGDLLA